MGYKELLLRYEALSCALQHQLGLGSNSGGDSGGNAAGVAAARAAPVVLAWPQVQGAAAGGRLWELGADRDGRWPGHCAARGERTHACGSGRGRL